MWLRAVEANAQTDIPAFNRSRLIAMSLIRVTETQERGGAVVVGVSAKGAQLLKKRLRAPAESKP